LPDNLSYYSPPDFTSPALAAARAALFKPAPANGVAPDNFHATSNHPEYILLQSGGWQLAPESRMDAVIVSENNRLKVVEPRRLLQGDMVVVGRTENGEDGIVVHSSGFEKRGSRDRDKFAFRTRGTRETPFSRSYDDLYTLLRHDRQHGYIVWVLGPAVAFDRDSRQAMQGLIENGYCHALMAGNALATHDLEAAHFGTGLGQDIYNQALHPLGHYNHLDVINAISMAGSIPKGLLKLQIDNGIIHACESKNIPYVLAGSIRDDGPLPGVIRDSAKAQDAMRLHAVQATTVITMATQLHSIAFGNMTPSYKVLPDGRVRQVFFYIVDISEFSTDKLANRGSAQACPILTNAQDFVVNLWHNLQGSPQQKDS
jgi:hypothetical protein